MQPTFSIITPVYNREGTIRDSVNSVLMQDYDSFELILVDDGSTDGTHDAIRELRKDARVRVHSSATNAGPSPARNRGLEMAKGQFVCFLDSDDLLLPGALRAIFDAIRSHAGVEYYAFRDNDYDLGFPTNRQLPDEPFRLSYADALTERYGGDVFNCVALSLAASERFSEEYWGGERSYWYSLLRRCGHMLYLPIPVAKVRRGSPHSLMVRAHSDADAATLNNLARQQSDYLKSFGRDLGRYAPARLWVEYARLLRYQLRTGTYRSLPSTVASCCGAFVGGATESSFHKRRSHVKGSIR